MSGAISGHSLLLDCILVWHQSSDIKPKLLWCFGSDIVILFVAHSQNFDYTLYAIGDCMPRILEFSVIVKIRIFFLVKIKW